MLVKIPENILPTFERKFLEFTQVHFTNGALEYYASRALIFQLSHLFRLPSSARNSSGKREKRGFNLREMLPLIRRSRQGRECKGIHYLKSCFSFAATISPTLLLCRCWRRCRRLRRLRRGDHRRCPALTAVTAAEICKLEGVLIDKEQRAAGSPRKT